MKHSNWLIPSSIVLGFVGLVTLLTFYLPVRTVSEYRISNPTPSQLSVLKQGQGDYVKFVDIEEDKFGCTSILTIEIYTTALTVKHFDKYWEKANIEHEFIINTKVGF